MKKIAMFAFAAAVLCGCAQKESDTVKMITEATFPPYEFLRGQEIAGIDVDPDTGDIYVAVPTASAVYRYN